MSNVMEHGSKTETINIRVSSETKELLEQAARLQDSNLSNFVISSALDAATQRILSRNIITLSRRDSEMFANALLNPPEPNEAFKKASARYAEMVKR